MNPYQKQRHFDPLDGARMNFPDSMGEGHLRECHNNSQDNLQDERHCSLEVDSSIAGKI